MNETPPHKPSWRKPAGMLFIIIYIGGWTIFVVSQAQNIALLPIALQAIVYLFAGVVWIAPMRPLLIWMETGKFRV